MFSRGERDMSAYGLCRTMLLAFTLIASRTFAQTPVDRSPGIYSAKTVPPARQTTISPGELRRLLSGKEFQSDMSSLWKKLGVDETNFDFSDCSFCETDLKIPQLPDRGVAIIRLYNMLGQFARFFV